MSDARTITLTIRVDLREPLLSRLEEARRLGQNVTLTRDAFDAMLDDVIHVMNEPPVRTGELRR